jgi:hypothetical protein
MLSLSCSITLPAESNLCLNSHYQNSQVCLVRSLKFIFFKELCIRAAILSVNFFFFCSSGYCYVKTVRQRTLWCHSGVALSRKKPTGHTALAASCAVPVEGGGGGRPVGAA